MSSFLSKWVVSLQPDVGAADTTPEGVLRDEAIERWVAPRR